MSSGRGCFGGRPQGRLFLTMRPLSQELATPDAPRLFTLLGLAQARGGERALGADRLGPGDVDDVVGEEEGGQGSVAVRAAGSAARRAGGLGSWSSWIAYIAFVPCHFVRRRCLSCPRKPERPPGFPGGLRVGLDIPLCRESPEVPGGALGRVAVAPLGAGGDAIKRCWPHHRATRCRASSDARARRSASLPRRCIVGFVRVIARSCFECVQLSRRVHGRKGHPTTAGGPGQGTLSRHMSHHARGPDARHLALRRR